MCVRCKGSTKKVCVISCGAFFVLFALIAALLWPMIAQKILHSVSNKSCVQTNNSGKDNLCSFPVLIKSITIFISDYFQIHSNFNWRKDHWIMTIGLSHRFRCIYDSPCSTGPIRMKWKPKTTHRTLSKWARIFSTKNMNVLMWHSIGKMILCHFIRGAHGILCRTCQKARWTIKLPMSTLYLR